MANESYDGNWKRGNDSAQQGNPPPVQKPDQSWDPYAAEKAGHDFGKKSK